MRIVIINASLKEKDDISSALIERILPNLKDCEYGILRTSDHMDRKTIRTILRAADAFLIVTPVCCGGLPSSLLGLLSEMEFHGGRQNIPVCTVIHGEQYDPASLQHAENMLKIWSERCHLHLCMNIRIGGSDAIRFMKNIPAGNSIMRRIDHAFARLKDGLNGTGEQDFAFSACSSFLYKRMMERYWKKELSAHGLEKSDGMNRIDEKSFRQ